MAGETEQQLEKLLHSLRYRSSYYIIMRLSYRSSPNPPLTENDSLEHPNKAYESRERCDFLI